MDAEIEPAAPEAGHPYASLAYARSLRHIGEPFAVPEWGCVVLSRPIAGAWRDAAGPYPLTILAPDADLSGGLARLAKAGFVSVTLVLDDYHRPPLDGLTAAFTVARVFKEHYVVDRRLGPARLSRHHRYYARRALRDVSVTPFPLAARLDEWIDLYARHHRHKTERMMPKSAATALPPYSGLDPWIADYERLVGGHGFPALPSVHHEMLAALPGVTALGAFMDGNLVSAHLWVRHGRWVRPHLAATDEAGLRVGAAYAVYAHALDHFSDCELINFGGAPGASGAALNIWGEGLVRFKRGFCNAIAPSYIAGAILDADAYAALLARSGNPVGTAFFPAYRRADALNPTGVFADASARPA